MNCRRTTFFIFLKKERRCVEMAAGVFQENMITMGTFREKLLARKILVLPYALESMDKRGYTKEDIIHGIMVGKITEKQMMYGQIRYVIESVDTDNHPIVLVITRDRNEPDYFSVVTIFPPIKQKFKRCI